MEEFEFRITNIKIITPDEIEISINVWDKNQVTIILENLSDEKDSKEKIMRVDSYSFTICPISYTMEPCKKCELEECFDIYHKYEYSDNLSPSLRRHWKVANIVDNLTSFFFKQDFFKNKMYDNLKVDDIDEE